MTARTQGFVTNKSPRTLARAILREAFTTEHGHQGLWFLRGDYFRWYGGPDGRWEALSERELRGIVYDVLERLMLRTYKENGNYEEEPLSVSQSMAASAEDAMAGLIDYPFPHTPGWVGGDPTGRPTALGECIAFRDVIVDVGATAQGLRETGQVRWVTFPRGPEFFSLAVLPFDFDPHARCPRYDRCMEEWSGGDAVWQELRDRFYGYCLMPTTKYARWLLEYGQSRGGKGTNPHLLRRMLGGTAFFGTTLQDITGENGLDGVPNAQVIVIGEVSELNRGRGHIASSRVKSILGQDELSVNVKYVRQTRHVIRATPILQSNTMPELPNDAKGLSAKLLALGFDHSFVGREDFGLEDALERELPGIALRWATAAVRLEAETDPARKFVMPESSRRIIERFEMQSNMTDAFLEAKCVRGGWSSYDTIRALRKEWEKETGYELRNKQGGRVTDHALGHFIETNTTWPAVCRERRTQGRSRPYGLSGLRARPRRTD